MCGGVYLRKEIRQTSSSLVAQIAVPVSCDTVSMLESFSKPDMLGLVSVPNCARKLLLRAKYLVDIVGFNLVRGKPFQIGEIEAKAESLLGESVEVSK